MARLARPRLVPSTRDLLLDVKGVPNVIRGLELSPAEDWLPITRESLRIDIIMRVDVPDLRKMKTWLARCPWAP